MSRIMNKFGESDESVIRSARACQTPIVDEDDVAMAVFSSGQWAEQAPDTYEALHQGPDEDYARGEAPARNMHTPVRNAHRVTTERMALLEPALVETLLVTCLTVVREGCERVVEMDVPEDAARQFLFGHRRIDLGIIFGYTDRPFSDGALQAIEEAKEEVFRPDWEDRVFDIDNVQRSVESIAEAE